MGNTVKLMTKSKDILETLLISDGVDYENILPEGRKDKKISMFAGLMKRDYRMWKIARKFRPDLFIGSDPSLSHVAAVLHKPCIMIGEDDYSVIRKLAWLMLPFADCILSPAACNMGPWEQKKIAFNGYMKLAYLHPSEFKPDRNKVSVPQGRDYCLIRLAKLAAHHDSGIRGLDISTIEKIIRLVKQHGLDVFIDSEYLLPDSLAQYRLEIPKQEIHHFMAFARFIISDSQSMSVEAAMLGIPSIRYNDFAGRISVLEELEHKYGLTFGINPSEPARLFSKLEEFLSTVDLNGQFLKKRDEMMREKINVRKFIAWFIHNYPSSYRNMRNDPGIQLTFK